MERKLTEPSAASTGHQQVFAYWSSLRAGGRLPSRAQLDPHQLKQLLPTVSLIDVVRENGAVRFRQRLAGTGLYSVYGREITGRSLEEVYSGEDADYWREHLDKVVANGRPTVGCQTVRTRPGGVCSILWIRLPLASDGYCVDMILGYDTPVGSPVSRMVSGIRAA